MFRLVLDIPFSNDQEQSEREAQLVVDKLREFGRTFEKCYLDSAKYRLQRDEDRQAKNYLVKNDNGHVGTKKALLYPEYVTTEDNEQF